MDRSKRWLWISVGLIFLFSVACRSLQKGSDPVVIFSVVPVADQGGSESLELFQGHVLQAKPNQCLVLYAYSFDTWWLQPLLSHPITEIKPDSTWQSSVHLGHQYAALVVDRSYKPSAKLHNLPAKGGGVLAIATVPGRPYQPKSLHFSGYDWEIRQLSSNWGGKLNPYDPANAWVDQTSFLHLQVVRHDDQWFCADVRLEQSLYQFTVRDISRLDPAATLGMYTLERFSLFNRELGINVSRWGNPAYQNAQFVVHPSYEPNNLHRFEAPAGILTFSFQWEFGRVSFRATRSRASRRNNLLSEHTFTSGVPSPGGESIHISLYEYGKRRIPMKTPAEYIESFQYTP